MTRRLVNEKRNVGVTLLGYYSMMHAKFYKKAGPEGIKLVQGYYKMKLIWKFITVQWISNFDRGWAECWDLGMNQKVLYIQSRTPKKDKISPDLHGGRIGLHG